MLGRVCEVDSTRNEPVMSIRVSSSFENKPQHATCSYPLFFSRPPVLALAAATLLRRSDEATERNYEDGCRHDDGAGGLEPEMVRMTMRVEVAGVIVILLPSIVMVRWRSG